MTEAKVTVEITGFDELRDLVERMEKVRQQPLGWQDCPYPIPVGGITYTVDSKNNLIPYNGRSTA